MYLHASACHWRDRTLGAASLCGWEDAIMGGWLILSFVRLSLYNGYRGGPVEILIVCTDNGKNLSSDTYPLEFRSELEHRDHDPVSSNLTSINL
jgi:hypothetical protein